MCLSCVFNESLGGRRRRRAYWCTPPPPSVNAMICSRWMCKILMWPQGAARLPNLPQYHCLSTQTTTTLDCEMALFATLPIRFNEQNRCLQLNPQAVKLKIVFFLTDFFFFPFGGHSYFRSRLQGQCSRCWDLQFLPVCLLNLFQTATCVFAYCSISEH